MTSVIMPEKKGYTDFRTSSNKCSCCPYGFHIDRDFVRYCDTLYNSAQLDKLRQHKRERRKEKKSVESYLGLGSVSFEIDATHKSVTLPIKTSTLPHDLYAYNDDLQSAVSDFEDTWQRSLKRSCSSSDVPTNKHGLQPLHIETYSGIPRSSKDEQRDLRVSSYSRSSSTSSVSSQSTAISNKPASDVHQGLLSPLHSTPYHSAFDFQSKGRASSTLSMGVNKATLSNIREQMAASLKRMRELEEQVKTIPILEVKLYSVNKEKESLLQQLQLTQQSSSIKSHKQDQMKSVEEEIIFAPSIKKNFKINHEDKNYLSSPGMASCLNTSLSQTQYFKKEVESQLKVDAVKQEKQKQLKSTGTSCSVLTRDIGIGYVPNKCRSIGVGSEVPFKELINSYKNKSSEHFTSVSSESLESESESLSGLDDRSKFFRSRLSRSPPLNFSGRSPSKAFVHSSTNTDTKYYYSKYVNTDPVVTKEVPKLSKYVSVSPTVHHKPVQTYDSKLLKSSGSQTLEKGEKASNLKLKDAGVGDCKVTDVLCTICSKARRSIGVGDKSVTIPACSKCGTLKSPSPIRKSPSIPFHHSRANCENCVLRQTETVGVGDYDINESTCQNCKPQKPRKVETQSVGINTTGDFSSSLSVTSSDIHICDKCSATIQSVAQGFAAKNSESKIPRPSTLKMSTTPNRSAGTSRSNSFKLSARKTVTKTIVKETTAVAKEKQKRFEAENLASKLNDELNLSGSSASSIKPPDVLPDFTNLPSLPHKKVDLSKEVKAACKVLNDYLEKPERGGERKTSSSLAMIKNEWFKVANQKNANPLLIEDYLDAFEDFSRLLLHKIVNLSDNNGNTALHYGVSYGNFDVVSILIDSKVCDVNKKNKAGYTSIMLVALAAIKNDAHHYVVQRLFSIGDINDKATQNGQTALMLAVSHGKKEIVKILLEAGAEVNLQDKDGSTALMCAAEHGQLDIAKILISHPDCDTTMVDNDDCNALQIAMDAGHKDIGLLIYANMNFSRGSSPYSTLKKKRSTPRSTPPPRTPTLRTPPLPSPSARSTNSIPSSFQFPT